jgi:beta-galactosidase
MHDDRIINDITYAMQGNKPLFAAEFQCGSREFHVVTNPREMELFYKGSIANGLVGWNYYMFSQGHNPSRKGYSGETFYWFNPLTIEGDRTSAFPLVKRMSKILKTSESLIVNAKRKAEICVLFYPPYYATELERPIDGNCDLQFKPSEIRRPAYFDGLLKILQVLNIDYDMIDLKEISADELSAYKQIWAFSTDEMNAREQQVIVDYMKSGGNCVLFPYLPDRENSQKPCTIIRDAIAISPSGKEITDSPLLDIYDLKDIKCANPQFIYSQESLIGAEVIARTINGSICGFTKQIGNGLMTHLGTWIGFDTEDHKLVYEAILKRSDARLKQASSDNDNIAVRERFTSTNSGILFIGNYYNEEQTGKITYIHPQNNEMITIPYSKGEMVWPAVYGVLTPVCLDVSDGIKILHSTSDILCVEDLIDQIDITIYGDRDLEGEMVLEGPNINKIKSVTIPGETVKLVRDDKRIAITYSHKHKKEMILIIKIN